MGGYTDILIPSLLVGVAIALLALGLVSMRPRVDPIRRRALRQPQVEPTPDPTVRGEPKAPVSRGLETLGRVVGGNETEANRLRGQLIQAGLRQPSALHLFLSSKVLLAAGLPLAFLVFNASLPDPVQQAFAVAMILCAAGYFVPGFWLSGRVQKRRVEIERSLPEALDLLVTCVEAGQGLDASLHRVSGDIAISSPALGEELNLTFLEVNAGVSRTQAFRRLYDRTGVDELKSLAATLAQAEMFGTSIGASLRVQASGMRTRRMHRAEERAAMVSVKMTVPLVLCILPSLFAVIMGPAAVNIYSTLFKSLG